MQDDRRPTPGMDSPAVDPSTQGGARRRATEKLQSERADGASTGTDIAPASAPTHAEQGGRTNEPLNAPMGMPAPRDLVVAPETAAALRARLRRITAEAPSHDNLPASDDEMHGDVQIGFIGSISEDAELGHMIMMMGVSNGPYRRGWRSATNRIVSEIYSPPRVTNAIGEMRGNGPVAGFAFNLTCNDPGGNVP